MKKFLQFNIFVIVTALIFSYMATVAVGATFLDLAYPVNTSTEIANVNMNSSFTMELRDYLLPKYQFKELFYYVYDKKSKSYIKKVGRVVNIKKMDLTEGTVFLFVFDTGSEAVINFKASKLLRDQKLNLRPKLSSEMLMAAKSFQNTTMTMMGSQSSNSSLLSDLEKNKDTYNKKNAFTSSETVLYTDHKGNLKVSQFQLDIDGISLIDDTPVEIGDVVMYDLSELYERIKDEKKE